MATTPEDTQLGSVAMTVAMTVANERIADLKARLEAFQGCPIAGDNLSEFRRLDGELEDLRARVDQMSGRNYCTMGKGICPSHGYVHGSEAEELRRGIEKLIEIFDGGSVDLEDILADLHRLLDTIDAHDSLASGTAS